MIISETVSPGYEDHQFMKARLELLKMLEEAEEDVQKGRTAPLKESFDSLCSQLKGK